MATDIVDHLLEAIDAHLAHAPEPGNAIAATAYVDTLLDLRLMIEHDLLIAEVEEQLCGAGSLREPATSGSSLERRRGSRPRS